MTRSRWVVVLVPATVYVWELVGPHGCSHRAPQREEVFDLLAKNYVEDDDNVFRFCYSPEFLTWALTPPGYFPEWLVGVRQSSNQRLRGFISGIPTTTHVYDRCVFNATVRAGDALLTRYSHYRKATMCEINFLCVHKKLRSMRLAPVLIKEVTRRVNRRGIWQAVYTAGVVIPKPVGACRYWHRSLNVRKLIDVEFSRLQPRMTLNRTIRLYKLPTVRWHSSSMNGSCWHVANWFGSIVTGDQDTRIPPHDRG